MTALTPIGRESGSDAGAVIRYNASRCRFCSGEPPGPPGRRALIARSRSWRIVMTVARMHTRGHCCIELREAQRLFAVRFAFFAGLFLVVFFAALTFRARAPRAFVVAAGRRRALALVFPRFAVLTVALLVPAFFVAVRFGVSVRLTGDLVLILAGFFAAVRRFEVAGGFGVAVRFTGALGLVLAGFFAAARRFEAAVRFRFDDFEARLGWPVRVRT